MIRQLATILTTVAVTAAVGQAQDASRFHVGAHAGYTQFGEAAALENDAFLGVDAAYRLASLNLGGLDVGLGFTFAASRPKTTGDQFPAIAFDFGDTTFIQTVAQRITMLQYAAQAQLGGNFGRARLYGMGGGGAYSLIVDARQNLGGEVRTAPMGLIGGGFEYAIGQDFGLRFEARDMIMFDYERDFLDPTVGYIRDRRIRDALPPPVPAKSSIHNVQASLVFTYVPNRRGSVGEGR
ncbi:MAG TPA: hypothetical protein VMO26_07990 [Vicinamibacterales bacterium]|nr:hypothetical protein [Vicinamibacterales bacterium]